MADWEEFYEEYTLLVNSDFSSTDYELRQDLTKELREDGSIELRDGP